MANTFVDILSSIKTALGLDKPAVLTNLIGGKAWNEGIPMFGGVQAQEAAPTPTPTPSPTPTPTNFEEMIKKGLLAFNPDTPLATQSAELAQAGEDIRNSGTLVDPLLPVLLALRESRGGADLRHPTRQIDGAYEGVNNPYNFRDTTRPGKFVNYPDFKTAISGGFNPAYNTESRGLVKTVLESPQYETYRKTGNLNDFNSVFTPEVDNNPSAQTLTSQMEELRKKYFIQ